MRDAEIVDKLCHWFPYAEDVTTVSWRAGLPPQQIAVHGSLYNQWTQVVRYARSRGRVGALLRAALDAHDAPDAVVEQWVREESQ